MAASMMERVALGDIGLEGHFKIVTTNPLTGRIRQQVEAKNTIHPCMKDYIKEAVNSVFSGVNPKDFDDTTIQASVRNIPGAFCLSYTMASYICPWHTVYLTDGKKPSGWRDSIGTIDGNVVAYASTTMSPTSGSREGSPTYSAFDSGRWGFTKRWDWPSTNGNGTISKILLLGGNSSYTASHISDTTRESRKCSNADYSLSNDGVYIAFDMNGLKTYLKATVSGITMSIYKWEKVIATYQWSKVVDLNLQQMGVDYGNSDYYYACCITAMTNGHWRIMAFKRSYMSHFGYAEVDPDTGEVTYTKITDIPTKLANIGAPTSYGAFVVREGEPYLITAETENSTNYNCIESKLDFSKFYENGSPDIGLTGIEYPGNMYGGFSEISHEGTKIKFLDRTGRMVGYDTSTRYKTNSFGTAAQLTYNQSVTYGPLVYEDGNWWLTVSGMRLPATFDAFDYIITASRLLDEPVVKQDVSMYVEYTLKYV